MIQQQQRRSGWIGCLFPFLMIALSVTPLHAQDEAPRNPSVEDTTPSTTDASNSSAKIVVEKASPESDNSGATFEDAAESVFKVFNKVIETVLFQDISFGMFKSQVIDDETGLPKVDKDNEPVMGGPEFPFVVAVLVLGSVFFTLRFGFINLRGFKHAIDVVRGKYDNPNDVGEISHFRALTSALSATVGLGNIAGVALAVTIGGPGAVFWMMSLAVFGMVAKFNSCTLAQLFRKSNPDGSISGGPMYYLDLGLAEKGGAWKPIGKVLAVIFAVMCIGGSLGGGNMFQSNQSFEAFVDAFNVPIVDEATQQPNPWPGRIFGIVMAAMVGAVIIGGIKRIGAATSRIVPAMCLLYVVGALVIILSNLGSLPSVIRSIFSEAFTAPAAYGGFVGVLVWGFKRAAFSNEAGLGSAAIAHSAAKTDEPVREGMVAMLGPFIDTIIICFMTACVVLITGAYNDPALVIGDKPNTIVHAAVTKVTVVPGVAQGGEEPEDKALIEFSIGKASGIHEDDKLVVQRKDKFVGLITVTRIDETSGTGEMTLVNTKKDETENTEPTTPKPGTKPKYENLPTVTSSVLAGAGILDGFDASSPKSIMAASVTGVEKTDDHAHLTLSLGSQHGITRGTRIHIHRGNKYLGEAIVSSTTRITSEAEYAGTETIAVSDRALTAIEKAKGASITVHAFRSLSDWFPAVLSICIILFAYSTMISWCYYGERAWGYLFGHKTIFAFRVIFICFVFLGAVMKLSQVLNFSDLMILCMAFPNIVGGIILAPKVAGKLKDYWGRYKSGEMKTYDESVKESNKEGGNFEI